MSKPRQYLHNDELTYRDLKEIHILKPTRPAGQVSTKISILDQVKPSCRKEAFKSAGCRIERSAAKEPVPQNLGRIGWQLRRRRTKLNKLLGSCQPPFVVRKLAVQFRPVCFEFSTKCLENNDLFPPIGALVRPPFEP